ncbi:hypothetical protein [Candidatus Laterigemmans baculatus]|uniref:hypothetical protein n=1 Tax=Candidatus Laterigemmans baculatus TaxID=2770505 RepID=UPI0013DD0A66|nr:hypothetical protein [Candidatus Laterigemmans baculatus]
MRSLPDGQVVQTTCLAHCYRGASFSGVLWAVWERTFTSDGEAVEPPHRWITCDLLRYQRDAWGYKDMDESVHPYFYSCPQKYLALVPLDVYGGNAEWREIVQQHHERRRLKRQANIC